MTAPTENHAAAVFVLGILALLGILLLASCFDSDEIPDSGTTDTGTDSGTETS